MGRGSGSGWSRGAFVRRVRVSGERWQSCQSCQPYQVVSGGHQVAREVDPLQPAVTRLAQATDCFHPAEDFFDTFAHPLTRDITKPTGGPSVHGAAAASGVL